MTDADLVAECEWMAAYISREWLGSKPYSRFARSLPVVLVRCVEVLVKDFPKQAEGEGVKPLAEWTGEELRHCLIYDTDLEPGPLESFLAELVRRERAAERDRCLLKCYGWLDTTAGRSIVESIRELK